MASGDPRLPQVSRSGEARSGRARAMVLAGAFTFASLLALGAGCSVIVTSDVPDVACEPAGGAAACPSGLVCDPTTRRCVTDSGVPPIEEDAGDDGPSAVDAGDARLEADAPTGPLELGAQCRVDGECRSKLCAASTVLTTAITQSTGPICTTPCCTSSDCPSSFVCFNGGTGGAYCVPGTLARRTAQGAKTAGTTCATDGECRSGLCAGTPKTCLDTCCRGTDCASPSVCQIQAVTTSGASHDIWACGAQVTGAIKPAGDSCSASAQCSSQACIGFGASQLCRPSCSNTASCKAVPGFENGHCLYGSSGTDYFRFCFSTTTGSDVPANQPCAANGDCQSDYCDAETKKCQNVCGKDSDCAPVEACRPSGVNTPYLRCVTRPL